MRHPNLPCMCFWKGQQMIPYRCHRFIRSHIAWARWFRFCWHDGSQHTRSHGLHQCYTNSAVWVKQSSKHLWVVHQESNTAKETLLSKIKYEQFAAHYNCSIKHIHSDNGIFNKSVFVKSCKAAHQKRTFAASEHTGKMVASSATFIYSPVK